MDEINELDAVVKRLRAPGGCPWDQAQDFKSLTPHIIEEAYELVDAIESEDVAHFKEEVGDVLLHVLMLSSMAEEKDWFTLSQVASAVKDKMIFRHPHVFSNKKADSVEEVWQHWETAKAAEKKSESAMDNVPKLPALLQASKIQKKAARAGFDWPDTDGPLDKLKEELDEFIATFNEKESDERQAEEAGDILFTLVNLFRKMGVKPEEALRKTNKKFVQRFQKMEAMSGENTFEALSLDEKEALWQKAKH